MSEQNSPDRDFSINRFGPDDPGASGMILQNVVQDACAIILTMVLALVFLLVLCMPASADTTLEMFDVDFPDECDSPFTNSAVECSNCHFPDNGDGSATLLLQPYMENPKDYRTIVSLDEDSKITVVVPAKAIGTGEPLSQTVSISGQGVQYQYGYTRNQEPFVQLENRWLSRAVNPMFFQHHDGVGLPVLDEPGEYIFRINLLYWRFLSQHGVNGWSRVILLWTVNVLGDEG